MDGGGLGGNDPVDEVANGNDAEDFVAGENRKVANAMVGHEAHAVLDRVRWAGGNDFAGNDFSDGRLLRGFAFEGDFTRVIAFGHDADHPVVLGDEKSADIFVGHQLDGVEYHCIWRDGPDLSAFEAEDFADGAGRDHDLLAPMGCGKALESCGQKTWRQFLDPAISRWSRLFIAA
jgi:hypothetical protein